MKFRTTHPTRPHRARPIPRIRTDIQALRALAVTLVVVNHIWPEAVPGGFVGVDVFFVISGYLITSHLNQEIERTGTVRFLRFYARRARRLLPAAMTVLAAVLAATWAFAPLSRWKDTAWEAAASAFYVENWLLAAKSVDYSAASESSSPVQHYWSLSVEEQFYLLWPALLAAAAWGATKLAKEYDVLFGGLLVLLGAGSFGLSLWWTAHHPEQAYFVTFARVWEFCVGAAAAQTVAGIRWNLGLRVGAAWAGLGMIVASAALYGMDTPFPGHAAALPVLGTALVLVAGKHASHWGHRLSPQPLLDSWLPQRLGDISYSVYLWHWPILVFAPLVAGRELELADQVVVAASSLAAGWLSHRFIELPPQRWGHFQQSPKLTFVPLVASSAVLALACAAVFAVAERREAEEIRLARIEAEKLGPRCLGPRNLVEDTFCENLAEPPLQQALGFEEGNYFIFPEECEQGPELMYPRVCRFGHGEGARVTLAGDSHAIQWMHALFPLARQEQWTLEILYQHACPFARVPFRGNTAEGNPAKAQECADRVDMTAGRVLETRPDLVITSTFARKYWLENPAGGGLINGPEARPLFEEGFAQLWREWTSAGIPVVAIADTPHTDKLSRDCLSKNFGNPLACSSPRAEAVPQDPLFRAAELDGSGLTRVLDLTDFLCDAKTCHSSVGRTQVFWDTNHLNQQYTRQLAPEFQARFLAARDGLTSGKEATVR